jgi:hypothetical protein
VDSRRWPVTCLLKPLDRAPRDSRCAGVAVRTGDPTHSVGSALGSCAPQTCQDRHSRPHQRPGTIRANTHVHAAHWSMCERAASRRTVGGVTSNAEPRRSGGLWRPDAAALATRLVGTDGAPASGGVGLLDSPGERSELTACHGCHRGARPLAARVGSLRVSVVVECLQQAKPGLARGGVARHHVPQNRDGDLGDDGHRCRMGQLGDSGAGEGCPHHHVG